MKDTSITQASHLEFMSPRGSLSENYFCLICGLIGIGFFLLGFIIVVFGDVIAAFMDSLRSFFLIPPP